MTEAQARREALQLAAAVLQNWLGDDDFQVLHQNQPVEDQVKISEEFKHIIEQLEKQWRKAS